MKIILKNCFFGFLILVQCFDLNFEFWTECWKFKNLFFEDKSILIFFTLKFGQPLEFKLMMNDESDFEFLNLMKTFRRLKYITTQHRIYLEYINYFQHAFSNFLSALRTQDRLTTQTQTSATKSLGGKTFLLAVCLSKCTMRNLTTYNNFLIRLSKKIFLPNWFRNRN